LVALEGCAGIPANIDNSCQIFEEYHGWYVDAKDASKKWGIPIETLLAIVHRESRFRKNARPPRKTYLWIFPGPHISSAFGYAQVLDGTWNDYKRRTGKTFIRRNHFGDAVNFIGWYADQASKKAGISKKNTYLLYIAYHEGYNGFKKGRYKKKKWLLDIAKKTESQAKKYRKQLNSCRKSLDSQWLSLF
jgi:hypothetical protein